VKRIALAIEEFSRFKGGAESYASSLASSLVLRGWEVHLFGRSWDGGPPEATFHRIGIPTFLPSWVEMIFFALRHRRMVKGQDFNVVLGFGNTIYMNVYQSHGGVHRFSTSRKVFSVQNSLLRLVKRMLIALSPKDKIRQWIESAPFRIEPRPKIIAISEMVRDDIASFYGIDKKEIELIYNGIDTERYHIGLRDRLRLPMRERLGIKEGEIAFLFISYELRKKGIGPLIEAAVQLKKSDHRGFKLVVVGQSPTRSLITSIARLGLEETAIFIGPTKSPEDYYASCDVMVLPTFYDACSLAVIEAMACGLPAITTTANGAAGIITHGVNGYRISHPPDSAEIAEAMKACFSPELLKRMSKEASLTGQHYSLERNHHEMLRVFNEVAGTASRGESGRKWP
jgi:UDP-glucose:(heptosyl)LPS alpha-1,3-glucosyltransferase